MSYEDRIADLSYDSGERAREYERVVQENGRVNGWIETRAWEDLVVYDAVGHCLLVGVREGAWGGCREWKKRAVFWETLWVGCCGVFGDGIGIVVAAGTGVAWR